MECCGNKEKKKKKRCNGNTSTKSYLCDSKSLHIYMKHTQQIDLALYIYNVASPTGHLRT